MSTGSRSRSILAAILAFTGTACQSTGDDAGLSPGPCAVGCPDGQTCFKSVCVADCVAAGGAICGSACVDLGSDDGNCGGCGQTCSGTQSCIDGGCTVLCPRGATSCIAQDGMPYCTDVLGDSSNCGACHTACATGQVCLDGGCQNATISCPTGQTLCDSDGGPETCRDLLRDPGACGSCDRACDAWQTCDGGVCVAPSACPTGFTLCPTPSGSTTCADLQTDFDNCGHCGDSCGPLGVCSGGGCSCGGGFTACPAGAGSTCTDLTSDAQNCGACGVACFACESCDVSSCAATHFLTETAQVPFNGYQLAGATIGDFNADGKNDLAVIGGLGGPGDTYLLKLVIYAGDGDGGFPTSSTYLPGDAGIFGLGSGDINGDGLTDLVLAIVGLGEFVGSGFVVLQTLSDGGHLPLGPFASDPSTGQFDLVRLAVADFNSDGLCDVAMSNDDGGIDVFYSTGDGGFLRTSIRSIIYQIAPSLAIGDLDGDGRVDLAAVDPYAATVLLQTADGGLGAVGPKTAVQTYALPVIAGRFLVLAGYGGSVDTYSLDGTGGLSFVASYPIGMQPGTSYFLSTASSDLNGDGTADLLLATQDQLLIWLNHGIDAGFGQPLRVDIGTPGYYSGVAAGDLNGDGRPDVAVAGTSHDQGNTFGTDLFWNECAP